LFNLTAGLESVVLGEDQVLGQVRSAYVKAKKLGTVKLILGKVFMKAVNTSRRVKTETKVNEGSVSISSAAVDCAEKELGNLKSVRALLIGAGEAGAITAENLRKRGTRTILVANRTYERGLELASKVAGKAIKFDRMYEVLPKVDLVIAAVSVSEPVLKANQIRRVLAKDRGARRLVVIDISQPRAVEEKVGLLPGVSLRNIDDLKEIVEDCIKTRQIEAEKAEKIIFEELERFERQLSRFLVEPVISEIFRRNEEIRRKELERAIRKIGESDKRKCVIIDRFSRELVERIMQLPIEELREAALQNDGTLLSAAEKLFRVRREKTV
ncbi:MAG: glutamyl-tRNA reductase, partial [Candidatus Bathyarchaeota archaeon]|nr:glutamyl-tRNA reductase [Candidatus Bathyarchaeota archaeon]